MSRQGKFKAFGFAVFACSALLTCSATLAVEPPPWWNDPNRGTPELLYEKGSSERCHTEAEARQKAYDAGLATIRKRITDNTNLWPWIQLVGTDIAFEWTQEDSWGKWYAWVLVSYPRAQFEKALQRAEERMKEQTVRMPVFVCPLSFGRESEEKFPKVVEKYKALGYGNAIWQTVEDLLYDKGFEIVTAPSNQAKGMLEQIFGLSAVPEAQTVKLPEKALLGNMNFFEVKTEEMSWGVVVRHIEYHAELQLELHDPHSNVKIPAKGEARDKDLLVATQKAAEQAVGKLVERFRGP